MRPAINVAAVVARICVGVVLVYSGWVKVERPHDFLTSVFQYQLLGPRSATFVAAVLPFVELTVGIALLCGLFTLGAASIAASLFAIFTIGQASALLRGIDADCGCFGAGEKVGWASLLRTAALLGGALMCVVAGSRSRRSPNTSAPSSSAIPIRTATAA